MRLLESGTHVETLEIQRGVGSWCLGASDVAWPKHHGRSLGLHRCLARTRTEYTANLRNLIAPCQPRPEYPGRRATAGLASCSPPATANTVLAENSTCIYLNRNVLDSTTSACCKHTPQLVAQTYGTAQATAEKRQEDVGCGGAPVRHHRSPDSDTRACLRPKLRLIYPLRAVRHVSPPPAETGQDCQLLHGEQGNKHRSRKQSSLSVHFSYMVLA